MLRSLEGSVSGGAFAPVAVCHSLDILATVTAVPDIFAAIPFDLTALGVMTAKEARNR